MMHSILNPEKGTWVLLCFIAFFAVIVTVNAIFITNALRTHSGVVTNNPYEKGLNFNQILQKAEAQKEIESKVTFKNSILAWELPVSDAEVTVDLIRPVKKGYDLNVKLEHKGQGRYEARLELPVKGLWKAKLKAKWNEQSYYKSHIILMK